MVSPHSDDLGHGLTRPLRILFLESDTLTGAVRIRPLLDLLRAENLIGGYAVVDRDMAISGDSGDDYDVVLAHRNPSRRQIAWLERVEPPLVYDIDDLLLGLPQATLRGRRAAESRAIAWCLSNAHSVTAPSRRLMATLETRLGKTLGDKVRLICSAGAEAAPAPKDATRPRLLWVSSAALPATRDLLSACDGIDAALRALDTDIFLLGRFAPEVLDRLSRREHVAWLAVEQYKDLLARGPFIAIAALPTGLPADQQTFIDCKSDIKAAEYGSRRIDGVYSPVPPYAQSDLPCSVAAANTAEAWQDAILFAAGRFPAAGNALADHAAIMQRRPSVIARQLFTALAEAHSHEEAAVRFRALPTPRALRTIEQGFRRLRAKLLR